MKPFLRAKCQSTSWTSELPLILLGLRSALGESDAISSFDCTFGVSPILPTNLQFLTEFQNFIRASTPPRMLPNRSVTPAVPNDLASCKFVLVRVEGSSRTPLAQLYSGPFLVLERYRSSFKLQVGARQEVVNISRLKPAFTPSDAEPAQPPERGRPRNISPSSVPQPAAKRAQGCLPSSAKPGGNCHPSSSAKPGGIARPSSPAPAEQRTRSGRTFAILPSVAGGENPVEDDISLFHEPYLPPPAKP